MTILKWGIIGAGNIARKFADDIKLSKGSTITAVASRSRSSAVKFAAQYAVKTVCDDIDQLLSRADVDIVYIATPHPNHFEICIAALNAGKHVLCEKPMSVGMVQLIQMVNLAKQKNLFLMEAMWTRFIPAMVQMLNLVKQGAIGEVNYINADFGYFQRFDPNNRAFDPKLGGGALLDVGIYPISLSYFLLGLPAKKLSMADIGQTGVDEQSAYIFSYQNGAIATLKSSVKSDLMNQAEIGGTKGVIRLPKDWWQMNGFELIGLDGNITQYTNLKIGLGYYHEIIAIEHSILNNELQNPLWNHADSISICKIMDDFRQDWGLVYPCENVD